MGALPRWLRGSCCRSCPPEAAPFVLRRDQAGVPSQSMPLLLSHCRASLDRSGRGDGLTSTPVIRTPPFAPTWTALSSPCSRMRRSKSGGHLKRTRRPQSGQTHSSAPDSAQPLRIISCVSRTDVTHPGIPGRVTQRTPVRHQPSNVPCCQAATVTPRRNLSPRLSQSNVDRAPKRGVQAAAANSLRSAAERAARLAGRHVQFNEMSQLGVSMWP